MTARQKILVTGSSGLIGSALIAKLQTKTNVQLVTPSRQELDLLDQSKTYQYFENIRPDTVYHLAARVGGISANASYPADFIFENTMMQTNVLEACRRAEAGKVLFPGSACAYPKLAEQPARVGSLFNGAVEPTNEAYAYAKLNGIVMARSFAAQFGMNIICPIVTNTYGAKDEFGASGAHVIPSLIDKIHRAKLFKQKSVLVWGTGSPLREFIFADDVADAFLFLLDNYTSNQPINVGTNEEISIAGLAELIAEIVGYTGSLEFDKNKPDGVARKLLDSTELMKMGWSPSISLKTGLSKVYAAYLENTKP